MHPLEMFRYEPNGVPFQCTFPVFHGFLREFITIVRGRNTFLMTALDSSNPNYLISLPLLIRFCFFAFSETSPADCVVDLFDNFCFPPFSSNPCSISPILNVRPSQAFFLLTLPPPLKFFAAFGSVCLSGVFEFSVPV